MLSVSSRFRTSEQADVNQVASKVYLVLGNYASSSAYGASASASSTDSSDYPAAGAIDGDRTEINVGPASGADNDTGKSSWRSSTAPSVTPQTLTIDLGTSRTINRIKLYHLTSHALSSYQLQWSTDNITYSLIDQTIDRAGTIVNTNQVDTVDFSDVTCRYVKLTVYQTVVGADKANVVELEIYRKVDVTSYLVSASVDRNRDYKLANPLASSFQLVLDNSDRFFSFSHSPTSAEVTSGFVNSELKPNIGVIIQYGFAYGGATPELATVFSGYVDRISIDPVQRTATIQGRDAMKTLINQVITSKLKTSEDIAAAMLYVLNLVNISKWETSIDTTSLTIDYFFVENQSVMTVIRDLVQASADAQFYFNESGIATFKYYVNSTPGSHLDSSQSDFTAGTVKTNIDTDSQPGQIGRKWFLIDDFSDGDFVSNPAWTNRVSAQTYVENTDAQFELGTVRTNLTNANFSNPDTLQRNGFKIDNWLNPTINSMWKLSNGFGHTTNPWSISGNQLKCAAQANTEARIVTAFTRATGTWQIDITLPTTPENSDEYADLFFIANHIFLDLSGPVNAPDTGYFVRILRNDSQSQSQTIQLYRDDGGTATFLDGRAIVHAQSTYTILVTRDSSGNMRVYCPAAGVDFTVNDTTYNTNAYTGMRAYRSVTSDNFFFGPFNYGQSWDVSIMSTSQAIFESQVIDQSAAIKAEGSVTINATSGIKVSVFTATSNDGVSFDPYVSAIADSSISQTGFIQSSTRRYIKYKVLFRTNADNGALNDISTPIVSSVTLTYTVTGWQCISNAAKYSPGTSGITAGLDLTFTAITGTWRCNVTMQNGSGAGMAMRLYFLTTGYDIPTATYLSGYYAQVDQANGKLGIYKINSSGTRTLLAQTAQAIDTSVHSLRVTRDSSGNLNLYWDEVLKVTTSDTGFSSNAALALEVAPLADTNGFSIIDDINYSPVVDGTGAINSSQATFESQVIDMGATVNVLGVFSSGTILPTGTSIAFYTATSSDGVTFDSYLAVTNGQAIPSTVKRYIKWKAVFTCPIDGGTKGTTITPYVTDVTLNYFVGTGSAKYPTSVSYVFQHSDLLLALTEDYSDTLGGDTAIYNDVNAQAKPLVLSGSSSDTRWQGTTQTPPVAISAGAPLAVSMGQTLTYYPVVSGGMDTGSMSGASPAAAAITFGSGAAGTWSFTRIHPTRPVLQIVITATGTITDLRLVGKAFSNSNTQAIQNSTDATSIAQNGDRSTSISSPYIVNTGIASTIAARLVSNFKNPTAYIPSATVRPTFSAQLNDRVTIVDNNTDVNADYVIAGISHKLEATIDGATAQTDLLLLKVGS